MELLPTVVYYTWVKMKVELVLGVLVVVAILSAFTLQEPKKSDLSGSPKRKDKLVLSEAEWQKRLTPEQYRILRRQGTEPAFCGKFYDNKMDGAYRCVGCDLPVFKSDAKFDSGTGWPSFFQPHDKDAVWVRKDTSHGMIREEVLCARCDGHLGHVFDDGPKPTGKRFCINSEVLKFEKKQP